MAELEPLMKLVLEGDTAIYGLASYASPGRVTALDHESFDYPVKDRAIIISFKAQLYEISTCPRALCGPQV